MKELRFTINLKIFLNLQFIYNLNAIDAILKDGMKFEMYKRDG